MSAKAVLEEGHRSMVARSRIKKQNRKNPIAAIVSGAAAQPCIPVPWKGGRKRSMHGGQCNT